MWRPQSYYDEPGRGSLARDGGGVLLTQGIHTLDLLLSLTGPVLEVCGYGTTSAVHRMETEDLVCAAARFASGAVGVIDATTAAYPGGPERIELIGTLGTARSPAPRFALTITMDERRACRGCFRWRHGCRSDGVPARLSFRGLARLSGGAEQRRPPRVSGREALKVHRLIDALIAAAASDRKLKASRTPLTSRIRAVQHPDRRLR